MSEHPAQHSMQGSVFGPCDSACVIKIAQNVLGQNVLGRPAYIFWMKSCSLTLGLTTFFAFAHSVSVVKTFGKLTGEYSGR